VAELVGFEIGEGSNGRAVMTLQAGPQHANPMGTLHGGVLCDIGDAAMGYAFASTLGDGERSRRSTCGSRSCGPSGKHCFVPKRRLCTAAARSATWNAISPTNEGD